jgi:hypothetical protein
MKNSLFLYILCFSLSFFWMSCEKADQTTTSTVANNEQLTSRWTTECSDCTDHNACCCDIELQFPNTTDAYISICGTADGGGTCSFSPPSPCSAISGGGQSTYLYSGNLKEGFCMVKGNSFSITNTSSSAYAYVKFTCHYDQVSPTYTYLTIPPNTTYFFGADGSCDIFQCNH